MFDETNQAVEEGFEAELPENLFDDDDVGEDVGYASEEGESGSEAEAEQNSEAGEEKGENHAEGPEKKEEGSAIRIKYNGEEKDLSLEEARTLAQKGMNYDHVVGERDRNRNAFEFLSKRAKAEGITVEQLMEREEQRAANQRLEAKMEEIRERDDDASDETIKSLARLELEAEEARREREKAKEEENEKNTEIEGWKRLFKEHPELIEADGSSKVSKGVFDLVKQGYSPTEAYFIERTRELEEQNKMLTAAETAKKKSVGSLSGVGKAEEDDFLAGFNDV